MVDSPSMYFRGSWRPTTASRTGTGLCHYGDLVVSGRVHIDVDNFVAEEREGGPSVRHFTMSSLAYTGEVVPPSLPSETGDVRVELVPPTQARTSALSARDSRSATHSAAVGAGLFRA